MKNPKILFELLRKNNVKFVIIGGFAAVIHGSSMVTEYVDFCTPETSFGGGGEANKRNSR